MPHRAGRTPLIGNATENAPGSGISAWLLNAKRGGVPRETLPWLLPDIAADPCQFLPEPIQAGWTQYLLQAVPKRLHRIMPEPCTGARDRPQESGILAGKRIPP